MDDPAKVMLGVSFFASIAFSVRAIAGAIAAHAKGKDLRRAAELPPEMAARLERMEYAIDAIAVEVERISEGQRFLTQLQAGKPVAEGAALRAGPGSTPR